MDPTIPENDKGPNCKVTARAIAAASTLRSILPFTMRKQNKIQLADDAKKLPITSVERLHRPQANRDTVMYLAYGSNLCVEKFRGDRGIQPVSQINVQVPSLRLVFDLPGVPYNEPCFANSALREHDELNASDHYRKDDWHKGLVGAVYEVTKSDYAHIIATEGGGSGYQDVEVDCYPFESSNPSVAVPSMPTTQPFKAHTLFAPPASKQNRQAHRPDPGYAQPSARYLKLITDGAAELALPYEYQDYLHAIRHFRITTMRQRTGQLIFAATWVPFIMLFFRLSKSFANKDGLIPGWLRNVSRALFASIWFSYDKFFNPVFGEGERSIPDIRNLPSYQVDEKHAVQQEDKKQTLKIEEVATVST